jgi:hypothetical protein
MPMAAFSNELPLIMGADVNVVHDAPLSVLSSIPTPATDV